MMTKVFIGVSVGVFLYGILQGDGLFSSSLGDRPARLRLNPILVDANGEMVAHLHEPSSTSGCSTWPSTCS